MSLSRALSLSRLGLCALLGFVKHYYVQPPNYEIRPSGCPTADRLRVQWIYRNMWGSFFGFMGFIREIAG